MWGSNTSSEQFSIFAISNLETPEPELIKSNIANASTITE
jgi:hypothetical protein